MKIRILSCAEAEIAEAMDYYNSQYAGLGYEFAVEVKECFKRITAFPKAWPNFSDSTKRCLLNRFPYGVLYQCQHNEIIVFAVMHLKQNPEKWNKLIARL
ncbi:MAG: type II toxin-antitoxin system RelE/ParE family toxin [Candidatus Riflebacteria bacterium]|nr:type II toxin-antitoxin system RelE/ParE family toxin [Candidatus Riflebacteria bacterium]